MHMLCICIVVKQCNAINAMQSDFNCFLALLTPDRNRVKNCVVPCWCCVGPRLWASRWALLLCSAYWKRITRNLHQNKERAITAISLEHIVTFIQIHRIFFINNLWMLPISPAFLLWETFHWKTVCSSGLDLFPKRENIFFLNTLFSPGSELWECSFLAQTRVLRWGRCQLPTVSIFSLCT